MKKILIVSTLIFCSFLSAQEDPYIMRIHEMEVSGDINAFIQAQKTYYKAIAKDAVARKKWAGWACLQSVTDPNHFIFIHHFDSPEQFEGTSQNDIWSEDIPKRLGLTAPDLSAVSANQFTAAQHLYQGIDNAMSGSPSNYWYINFFKADNTQTFVANNALFGEEVVKPQLGKGNHRNNWAYGLRLTNANWDQNQGMLSYNGISFDGYASLAKALRSTAYSENAMPNKFQESFNKKVVAKKLQNGFSEIHRTLYRVIDNTWR